MDTELIIRRIEILNKYIAEKETDAENIIGCLESARRQRDRAIEILAQAQIDDAVNFPSFLTLEEVKVNY